MFKEAFNEAFLKSLKLDVIVSSMNTDVKNTDFDINCKDPNRSMRDLCRFLVSECVNFVSPFPEQKKIRTFLPQNDMTQIRMTDPKYLSMPNFPTKNENLSSSFVTDEEIRLHIGKFSNTPKRMFLRSKMCEADFVKFLKLEFTINKINNTKQVEFIRGTAAFEDFINLKMQRNAMLRAIGIQSINSIKNTPP